MKTAEQVWEKLNKAGLITGAWSDMPLSDIPDHSRQDFLAALHEYGAAVRQRAAGVCRDMHGGWVSDDHLDCAAAIERVELP